MKPSPGNIIAAARLWWATPTPPEGRIAAILLLVLSAPLAWYYFIGFESSGHIERDAPPFYRTLRDEGRSWFSLPEEKIAAGLRTGNFDSFSYLAVRSAMVRWRYRPQFPALWDNLMRDFENGIWSAPKKERWESLFANADQVWLAARRQAGSPNIQSAQVAALPNNAGVRISFPDGTLTSKIGSMITIVEETEKDAKLPERISVYWYINGESIRADRYAQTAVRETTQPGAAKRTFLHEIDFSGEPAWIAPEARLTMIDLRGPGLTARIATVNALDSPLLHP